MTRRKISELPAAQPTRAKKHGACHRVRHRVSLASTARGAKKTSATRTLSGKAPLKTNRDDLTLQLGAAEARVRELEERLAAVTDRIAWIADRLHSLLEDSR